MAAPQPTVLPPYGHPPFAAPYGGAARHTQEGHPYAQSGHFPFYPGAPVSPWAAAVGPLAHAPTAAAMGHWPMAAAAAHAAAHGAGGFGPPQAAPTHAHGPPSAHPPAGARPPPAPRGPLAALMLAVEQSAQEEGGAHQQPPPHQPPHAPRGAKRARPAAVDSQWYPCSSSSGGSSATSSPTSSVGSEAEAEDDGKLGESGSGHHGPTGAGSVSHSGQSLSRRGRRKGSKDGWNAAGAAALASEEDKVGLLPGVHTANLDKYMPAKEKVKRTRTVLAGMSFEEKTERRKERARKYSQDLRRRQLESIQELLIEARRLNVFQLLVQESADLLLVLAPLSGADAPQGQGGEQGGAVVLFANAAAEAALLGQGKGAGGEQQQLLGRGLLGFVHPEDRSAVVAALRGASAAKGAQQRVRCRLLPAAAAAAGPGTEVDLLLREGTQGVVCNGRVVE